MSVLTAPIRIEATTDATSAAAALREAGAAALAAFVAAAEYSAVEADIACARISAEAVAEIRRARRLGLAADVGDVVRQIDRLALDLAAAMRPAFEAIVQVLQDQGITVELAPHRQRLAQAIERASTAGEAAIAAVQGEAAIAVPPPDAAPVNRAFSAYRAALMEAIPGAAIAEEQVGLTGHGDDLIAYLTVQLPAPIEARELVRLEQRAHDAVRAEDPALVGLLALRYVDAPVPLRAVLRQAPPATPP